MIPFWLVLLFSYLAGAIPFGFLVYKHRTGRDIRAEGSGNIGATNVLRTLGRGAGATVLALDAGKGALAALFALHALGRGMATPVPLTPQETAAAAGLFAILGHTFPVYLGFRGGKGVATACGVFLVVCPAATLLVVALFAAVVAATRYVSAGSIAGAAALPALVRLLYPGEGKLFAAALAVGLAVIALHRKNIARLMRGTEKRLGATAGNTAEKP